MRFLSLLLKDKMPMIKKIMAFLEKDFLIHKSYKLSFFLSLLTILASVVTFYFIARIFGNGASAYLKAYGGQYFPFVLIGIAFSDFLFTGLGSFSHAIRDEQMTGTLGALLISPVRISNILIGSSMWGFIFASFRVFCYLILGTAVFGASINLSNLFIALIILLLSVTSFSGLGIIAGSFVIIFKRGDPVTWAFSGVSALLGGVYFPITVLPQSLQKISYSLPMTYSLRAVRLALLGDGSLKALAPDILVLAIFSALILPLSIMIFKYSVKKAKRDGTLLQY